MADNYTHATVSPDLPAALFTEDERRALQSACGLTCERDGCDLYFLAELCFFEAGEDEGGARIDCLRLMQQKLRQLDAAQYPFISIHAASTCSKMRRDEFAGFAYFITRDEIRSWSTWRWLDQQEQSLTSSAGISA